MKCYPVLFFLSDSVPCACCAVVLLYVVGLNCKMGKKCVSIIVLGDIGRSPRMQYHSLSLADEGYNVDVIGYGGSEPMKELLSRENVEIRRLISTPDIKCWFSYLLYCFLCSSIATIVGYKNNIIQLTAPRKPLACLAQKSGEVPPPLRTGLSTIYSPDCWELAQNAPADDR
uniref:(California timema) hypothetical protein n=1 Tax=Timema californicum TaxID=61474 RepID=A0A7R9J9W6_TIMCA|nr:unnamed protein product [Timema californicum]